RDGGIPFTDAGGVVAYNGDQTRRSVEVAPLMPVDDTLPGSEVFMRVRTGDGRIDARVDAGNSGTGTIAGFTLADSAQWNGGAYRIDFAANGAYSVTDANGDPVATGTHAPGDTLAFAGLTLSIEGNPADGDGFTIGPAQTRDVFATLDALLGALTMEPTTGTQQAAQQNALQGPLRDIATAQGHLIDARADGGARLAALDQADDLRMAQGVTIEGTLSGMRDLDYAEAISRFELEMVALEAAQLSFMQMQRLSLFDYMR